MANPVFFSTPAKLNTWFRKNHAKKDELIVGFYKKTTGKPSITWPESVDEALCYGWIDGIRRRIDDEIYTIRFTPRRPASKWSARNIERYQVLTTEKRIQPAGKLEFAKRKPVSTAGYAYENQDVNLGKQYEKQFKGHVVAWNYFQGLPSSLKNLSINWVVSAKREETRQRRLDQLISRSSQTQILPQFLRDSPRQKK